MMIFTELVFANEIQTKKVINDDINDDQQSKKKIIKSCN